MPAAINLDISAYRAPVNVEFQNICFAVKSRKGQPDKQILKDISGKFVAGQLIAILGPSGAGKTTLLNVLSGFKLNGVSGTVCLNGEPTGGAARRNKCSHITQDCEMLENLTVLETMNTAACLKLGRGLQNVVRLKIINDVVQILNLMECIHTRVKSLSGGESKRLSIAVELITNPPVMYFDEPTSGLDSSASLQIMSHLRELAKAGRNIVCTIHQPSSRLLELIDTVYLISQGQCLYNGALEQMVGQFALANYHCPPQYNRADFALEVASNERYGDYEKLVENEKRLHPPGDKRLTEGKGQGDGGEGESLLGNGASYQMAEMGYKGPVSMTMTETPNLQSTKKYSSCFWDQMLILIGRSCRNSFRDLLYCKLRIIASAIVGMLLGSIFWQVGASASKITTNASCLYFFLLFILFANALSTVVTFPFERKVFMREHLNNWYSVGAYVVAKIIAGLPLQLICPTIFIGIAYFMTGQPHYALRFFLLWAILILIAIMSDSLGLLVGALCDVQLGIFIACAIFIPNLLFSGFFIKYSELPVAYRPLYSVSFIRYGFEGSLNALYAFDREVLVCDQPFCLYTNPEKFLRALNMDGNMYLWDVVGLAVWTVALWILLYVTVCIRLKMAQ